MTTPFDRSTSSIGVTVVTSDAVGEQPESVAVLRLDPAPHNHPAGQECIACAAAVDVRAMLFDLLQQRRNGQRPPFEAVVIDAHALTDPQQVIDRLDPHAPAIGLRDHTVARSFHLSRVI